MRFVKGVFEWCCGVVIVWCVIVRRIGGGVCVVEIGYASRRREYFNC